MVSPRKAGSGTGSRMSPSSGSMSWARKATALQRSQYVLTAGG